MALITISRQIASYGDEIAALAAEKLNYQLMDREQIHELAEKCDPEFTDACALFESEIPRSFWEKHFFGSPAYTSLFEALNYEMADQGDAVILGRGSQLVLREVPGILKLRIVAPTEVRVKRIMKQEDLSTDEAWDYVEHYGHLRRNLVQSVFRQDIANWAHYDLVINTADIKVETAAEVIRLAVETMEPVPDEAALKESLARRAMAKHIESAIRKKVTGMMYREIEVDSPSPGRIVIKGLVQNSSDIREVERIAAGLEGVTDVDNQVKLLPSGFL